MASGLLWGRQPVRQMQDQKAAHQPELIPHGLAADAEELFDLGQTIAEGVYMNVEGFGHLFL